MKLKKLINVCFADKWLKLLAVALAIVTWVYVSQITRDTETESLRLEFKAPADHFIMDANHGAVFVTVEGSAAAMRLLPNNLIAVVDVAEKKADAIRRGITAPVTLNIRLVPADIQNLPPTLDVKEFDPARVTITLDRMDQKRLPVVIDPTADLAGLVKPGFEIYTIYPVPKEVVVRGPKSVLSTLESVHPYPIPVSALDKDFSVKKWRIKTTVEHNGKPIDCLQVANLEEIIIKVVPKKEKAVVKNVRVEVRGLPGLIYSVFTEDNTKPFTVVPEVEILGPKKALADATVRAFIDLTDILDPKDKPQVMRALQFTVAPGIEVLTKPPSVMVQIKKAPTPPDE